MVQRLQPAYRTGNFAAGKHERFETMLLNVVNGALKSVKKTTQEHMAKMMQQGGGMGGLFGK